MNAADRLIVALDGDAAAMGAVFLRLHRETPVRWFKVGPQLLLQHSGMIFIENMLRENGVNLMYDGKIYDTADTVKNVVSRAFSLGAHFVTVHATPSVMEAAMRAKPADDRCKVLAVPLLTDQLPPIPHMLFDGPDGAKEAARLTDGIVYPPALLNTIHDSRYLTLGPAMDRIVVCPGIRQVYTTDENHGHWRSPTQAVRDGADYLVVGRPIWQSEDPVAAALAILAEMEAAL